MTLQISATRRRSPRQYSVMGLDKDLHAAMTLASFRDIRPSFFGACHDRRPLNEAPPSACWHEGQHPLCNDTESRQHDTVAIRGIYD
jgi:hypothetical protein